MTKYFILLCILIMSMQGFAQQQGFDHFITVDGNRLMDGDQEYRFLSFNIPNLNYVEDEMAFSSINPYDLPTEFEIRDAFESIKQMGGQVIRFYTIPVRNTSFPKDAVTFVEAPGQFNEEAFKVLDLVLALANEYEIRLIFPLLNNWQWMGGVPNYAAFRGKSWDDFWVDEQLIADFKQTIDFVLNRTNTITGIPYKEDKTILCWETGNELQSPDSWTIEMARYIKSIDQNHLLMDGYHAIDDLPIQEVSIQEPAIDIVTSHHYERDPLDMIRNVKRKVAQVGGKKPYILGEIGFISTAGMEALLDTIIQHPHITGALTWSLRYHHRNGGFYWHSEPVGLGLYKAYHWPGFNSGHAYDEYNYLQLWREKAFEIQKKEVPPMVVPKAPELLAFQHPHQINWRGSAGAKGYNLYRATQKKGPWEIVGYHLSDAAIQNFALFHDKTAVIDEAYYYKITALNESGESDASKIAGPLRFDRQAVIDNMSNVGTLFHSHGLTLQTGEDRTYKEITHRANGTRGAQLTYKVPGSYLNINIYAFEDRVNPQLQLYGSTDGNVFNPLDAEVSTFTVGEQIYDYDQPRLYIHQIPGKWKYIRIEFIGPSSIARVELEYGALKVR